MLRKIGTILIVTVDGTFQEAQMNRSKSLRICEVYAPWILYNTSQKKDGSPRFKATGADVSNLPNGTNVANTVSSLYHLQLPLILQLSNRWKSPQISC